MTVLPILSRASSPPRCGFEFRNEPQARAPRTGPSLSREANPTGEAFEPSAAARPLWLLRVGARDPRTRTLPRRGAFPPRPVLSVPLRSSLASVLPRPAVHVSAVDGVMTAGTARARPLGKRGVYGAIPAGPPQPGGSSGDRAGVPGCAARGGGVREIQRLCKCLKVAIWGERLANVIGTILDKFCSPNLLIKTLLIGIRNARSYAESSSDRRAGRALGRAGCRMCAADSRTGHHVFPLSLRCLRATSSVILPLITLPPSLPLPWSWRSLSQR